MQELSLKMKRKIIQIADTTQAITIPREFSLNNELKISDLKLTNSL